MNQKETILKIISLPLALFNLSIMPFLFALYHYFNISFDPAHIYSIILLQVFIVFKFITFENEWEIENCPKTNKDNHNTVNYFKYVLLSIIGVIVSFSLTFGVFFNY